MMQVTLSNRYYELNNKFINLLEENQRIKQQCKNLEEKNQENLRLNSELNEKNQEISRTNTNLIEENKEVSRINSELKEKLEEKEKKFEEFQQYVSNLENQRNEELQQLQKLEMMSQNLDKNLGILKLNEIDENIIKTFRENNEDFLASFSNKAWGSWQVKDQYNTSQNNQNIVELFKLWLGNLDEHLKLRLPVDYKRAITDYLREIGRVIKDTIETHWEINFFENVLLVLTVPAEYSKRDNDIMKRCIYNAGLIKEEYSKNLQFTTEPEAAAIYCMENKLNELQEDDIGMTFMVVNCGGGTVNLTTRKLVGINPL
ncbi:unnamed protein product [Rhizophagus irregularis]|nr:unnamed protein product [Rhizophagus irregularis]